MRFVLLIQALLPILLPQQQQNEGRLFGETGWRVGGRLLEFWEGTAACPSSVYRPRRNAARRRPRAMSRRNGSSASGWSSMPRTPRLTMCCSAAWATSCYAGQAATGAAEGAAMRWPRRAARSRPAAREVCTPVSRLLDPQRLWRSATPARLSAKAGAVRPAADAAAHGSQQLRRYGADAMVRAGAL